MINIIVNLYYLSKSYLVKFILDVLTVCESDIYSNDRKVPDTF